MCLVWHVPVHTHVACVCVCVCVKDGQLFNYRDNRDYFIGNN